MNVFQPMLALSLEPNGNYTLYSTTLGPNSCVRAGNYVLGAPEGQSAAKSAFPITINIDPGAGQICLQVLTPVFHTVPGIKKSDGVLFAEVFVMYGGKLKGKQVINFDQATKSPTIEAADAIEMVKATTYHLSGNGINIVLSMEDLNEMLLEYEDDTGKRTFKGRAIYRSETSLGLLLSVSLENITDLHEITFSLAVPMTNVPENAKSVTVKTFAVKTVNKTSLVGPGIIEGQTQTYETCILEGNAW